MYKQLISFFQKFSDIFLVYNYRTASILEMSFVVDLQFYRDTESHFCSLSWQFQNTYNNCHYCLHFQRKKLLNTCTNVIVEVFEKNREISFPGRGYRYQLGTPKVARGPAEIGWFRIGRSRNFQLLCRRHKWVTPCKYNLYFNLKHIKVKLFLLKIFKVYYVSATKRFENNSLFILYSKILIVFSEQF